MTGNDPRSVQTVTNVFRPLMLRIIALFGHRWFKLMFGGKPIYRNVKRGKEQSYQASFLKIIDSVDVVNLTNQASNRAFSSESACRDLRTIEQMANQAKAREGLSPIIIRVMVMQYLHADPKLREADKSRWIQKVMSRDDSAYFPDAVSMYNALYSC